MCINGLKGLAKITDVLSNIWEIQWLGLGLLDSISYKINLLSTELNNLLP